MLSDLRAAGQLVYNVIKTDNVIESAYFVSGRPLRILIVGLGGTGKTSLVRWLETFSVDDVPVEHVSSTFAEDVRVPRVSIFSRAIDFPGQLGRGVSVWEELRSFEPILCDQKQRLIFLMCCAYGFHSHWGESSGGLSDVRNSVHATDFAQAIEQRQEEEIDFAKEFVGRITRYRQRILWLDVVLKQDLWWDDAHDVEKFYAGRYLDGLVSAASGSGAHIRHFFAPLCLRRAGFRYEVNSQSYVAETCGGFDDSIQRAGQAYFMTHLRRLILESRAWP